MTIAMPINPATRTRTDAEIALAGQLRADRDRIKASRKEGRPQEIIRPPSIREARGETEWPQEQIQDSAGSPGSPFRAVDTLRAMERNGSITADMKHAGHHFQDDFDRAGLQQLRAADMGRVPSGKSSSGPTLGQIAARESVWRAVNILGGLMSPSARCAWHVLGNRDTLADWARREGWCGRPIHKFTASGILVGALGALVAHYGIGSPQDA